ncbi:hypothetical protein V7S43_007972 [Phytophthora oleae]|uniref:Calmodulin n=1 Tax=Phytophthora oleae TaxID=2107226 RepID=A0ABD3FN56_9STRA
MGTSSSKTSPLAPTFERMSTWGLKASRGLLQTYKDKDMDFGLDSQGLAELLGGDKDWAENIIDAFKSPSGIINALAFICGACLVSSGPALEKAGMIFDGLDFDGTEQISMDEMTIAFLCCARGLCVMSGVGTVPSDEELESVTLQAYRDLNKGSTQSITKSEFTKWVLEFASGTEAPITREVTLENVLEQFRVVPPTEKDEVKEDNNLFSPPPETYKAQDQLQSHDTLHQDLAGDPTESAAEQDQTTESPEPLEPEFVVDEHGTETTYDNDQSEETLQDEAPSGYRSEEQIASDSYEPAIEIADFCGVSESDYPTFVADAEEEQSTLAREQTEDYLAHKTRMNEDVHVDDASTNLVTQEGAAGEALSELDAAAECENDDTLYEQDDDFAQETPRVDPKADANVCLPGDNSEGSQPTESSEDASAELSTKVSEPATNVDESEVTNAQNVLETEGGTEEIAAQLVDDADEPPAMTPDTEIVTTGSPEAGEEGSTNAALDPTGESPRTDLNAFDAYDYQDPRFDGSCGLPSPEPQELLDDIAAVLVSPMEVPDE